MKIRKKLEQELSKKKETIRDICSTFDRKLFILFTRRLEYQYRIYEQVRTKTKIKKKILQNSSLSLFVIIPLLC